MALFGICLTDACRARLAARREERREARGERREARYEFRLQRQANRITGKTSRTQIRSQAGVLEVIARTSPGAVVPGAELASGIGEAGLGVGAAFGGFGSALGAAQGAGLLGGVPVVEQPGEPSPSPSLVPGVPDMVLAGGAAAVGLAFLAGSR